MSENYALIIKKKPDVTDLAGEKVMIDFESGKYFLLTGAANDIWDMLSDCSDTESIVRALIEVYEVEIDECRSSVLRFLVDLENIGFVSLEKCD